MLLLLNFSTKKIHMKTIEMVERIKSENIRKKLTFEQKYDEGLREVTEELKKK